MAESREPTTEEKIADALRAAPEYIADNATVVDWDMTTVLRKGTSEWLACQPRPASPGQLQCVAIPPLCSGSGNSLREKRQQLTA
jgi:hypothetical protein